jgi:hypothetical protein
MIYSSRKVIKNDDNSKNYNHYYKEDLWKYAANYLKDYMPDGMTIYAEIVGYTPTGELIQKGYDYGYQQRERLSKGFEWPSQGDYEDYEEDVHYGVYIYRITHTNWAGQKYEFSAFQVQEWCKRNGLKAVPLFFYGKAREILSDMIEDSTTLSVYPMELDKWQAELLEKLSNSYNMEKDCTICKNKVPAEGFVVRVEGLDYDAYKLKSFRFTERETKELDKGEIDIETQQSE